MSAPVISLTSGILGAPAGEAFVFQPSASNTPTSWAATGLPTGVTINTSTGRISGAATTAGNYVATLTATNGTGTSPAVEFFIRIEGGATSSSDTGDDVALTLDVDVATRAVSVGIVLPPTHDATSAAAAAALAAASANPAAAAVLAPLASSAALAATSSPLFLVKRGDFSLINVRFSKGATRIDPVCTSLIFRCKGLDSEPPFVTSETTTTPVVTGAGAGAVYTIAVDWTGTSVEAFLADSENDAGTSVELEGEIEWRQTRTFNGESVTVIASTQTFPIRLDRDLDA